jgi:Flp pilus assembly protein TadB
LFFRRRSRKERTRPQCNGRALEPEAPPGSEREKSRQTPAQQQSGRAEPGRAYFRPPSVVTINIGKILIAFGLLIVLAGVVLLLVGRVPWLGRLPGDIHYQRGNFTFYFPLATSLLLSVVLTLILYFLGRR